GGSGVNRLIAFTVGKFGSALQVRWQWNLTGRFQINRAIEGNDSFAVLAQGTHFAGTSAHANAHAFPHFAARLHQTFPNVRLKLSEEKKLDRAVLGKDARRH